MRTSRVAGICLVVLSLVPFYAWLRDPLTGLAGGATADMAANASGMVWAGTMMALVVALIASRIVSPESTDRFVSAIRARVIAPTSGAFACAVALLGLIASLLVQRVIFHGEPVLIDAITQIVHARYIAGGHAQAPADTIGFFRMQQSAPVIAGGWVSQYPPLHVFLLACFGVAHAMWLEGPVALAVALYFSARAIDLLAPQRAAARVGVGAAALSPFMLAHAATFMSHTTAAAFIAIALYGYARFTLDASRGWVLLCGTAIGLTFATRPLTGLTVGVAFALALMLKREARAVAMLVISALPFAIIVAAYNAHFFGAPTRFGYDVALGPNASLGFGVDPWGNAYGIKQAIAYTSAELNVLSLQMFESPLPLIALVGLSLALWRPLQNMSVLVLLALAPLVASLLYWHHGLFMGPRMLNEYGIVWSVLITTSLTNLVMAAPAHMDGGARNYSPRSFAFGLCSAALVGAMVLAPQRLSSYETEPSRAFNAASAAGANALVFVHGGWGERLGMQLAARGYRLDEVEAALRQNSTCEVQQVVDGVVARSALQLAPRATDLPRRVEFPAGNPVRVSDNESYPAACAVQVRADSAGVIDPSSLMWRGGLPGIRNVAPLIARDLGPAKNALLAAAHPDARVLMRDASGSPVLVSYNEGMRRLWGALE